MCTSMNGMLAPTSASRRATLVCVSPPGLMMIASILVFSPSNFEAAAIVSEGLGDSGEERGFSAARLE